VLADDVEATHGALLRVLLRRSVRCQCPIAMAAYQAATPDATTGKRQEEVADASCPDGGTPDEDSPPDGTQRIDRRRPKQRLQQEGPGRGFCRTLRDPASTSQ
jgi:hypothetical protein